MVFRTSPARICPAARRVVASTLSVAGLAALVWWQAAPALGQTPAKPESPPPTLRVADILSLAKPEGEFLESVPDSAKLGVDRVLAFEDNQFFLYVFGDARKAAKEENGETPWLVRRVFLLKPSVVVVDDRVRLQKTAAWVLQGSSPPKIDGRRVRMAEGKNNVVCETLLPRETNLKTVDNSLVETSRNLDVKEARFLHVIERTGDSDSAASAKVVEKEGQLQLTISGKERTFQLTLPAGDGAGKIAVRKPDGKPLLARRLLPSGIMPHGRDGVRLIERWDSAYRRDRMPGWDTGRPSGNLTKVVEEGTIRPCRTVVLGCGTGNNAIYLAGKGFDVTGIDVAPTALTLAEEKARKAGVEVQWLVADVLAPPKRKPFDFIFDRGCYHGVRRHNAAGYVAAIRQLTRPGSEVLILAGNANEARRHGPPRVKEEEIRNDFSPAFDFVWLRETKFDTRDPKRQGALAWSILLRRKGEK